VDLDALPEGHVVADLYAGRLGIGVGPSGCRVALALDDDVEAARLALARAGAARIARGEQLERDVPHRKVVIALDHDRPVALGQDRAVPHRADASGCGLMGVVAAGADGDMASQVVDLHFAPIPCGWSAL